MITPPNLAAAPSLDVWHLILESSAVGLATLLILIGFSIASWAVMWERHRRFARAERESREFLERFHEGGSMAAIGDDTKELKGSPLAGIFRAGFREISLNPSTDGGAIQGENLQAVERVLRKNGNVHLTELERSLGLLATTASATPFIGLFGTVYGIMEAFRGIGLSGNASLQAYAPGIAEALIATAAGLFAAIPAVIGYNHFLGRLRSMDSLIEEFIADFIHRLQGRRA